MSKVMMRDTPYGAKSLLKLQQVWKDAVVGRTEPVVQRGSTA